MTIPFEKLKARLLANLKVKSTTRSPRSSRLLPSCSGLACAQACLKRSWRPG